MLRGAWIDTQQHGLYDACMAASLLLSSLRAASHMIGVGSRVTQHCRLRQTSKSDGSLWGSPCISEQHTWRPGCMWGSSQTDQRSSAHPASPITHQCSRGNADHWRHTPVWHQVYLIKITRAVPLNRLQSGLTTGEWLRATDHETQVAARLTA